MQIGKKTLLIIYLSVAFWASGCHSGKIKIEPAQQQQFITYTNVLYGTDTSEQIMDVHLPVNRNSYTPVIMLIHGGAWVAGKKEDFNGLGLDTFFTAAGIAVLNINYRLDNKYAYPAPIDDIGMVMDYLTKHATEWNVNPNDVVLLGRSSGGHLALQYAYTHNSDNRIRAVIDAFGPTNLTDSSIAYKALGINVDVMLGDYATNQQQWHDASPIYHMDGAVPTLIFQGTADTLVYPIQSQMLGDSLLARNIPCIYIPWTGAGHGWITERWLQSRDATLAWLRKFI